MAANYTYNEFEDFARRSGLLNEISAYDLQLAQANPDVGMALLNAKNDWHQATDDAGRSAANQRAEALRSNAANSSGITSYTGGSWGLEYNPIVNGNPSGSMVPQTTGGGGTPSSFTQATANGAASNWSAASMPTFQAPAVTPTPAAPTFGPAPQYDSRYTPDIDSAAYGLNNYPAFTYSPYTDRYDADIQAAREEAFNRDPFSYDFATDPVYQAYAKQYRREGERSMQNTLAQNAARTGGMASSAAVAAAQQANNYYNAQLADKIPQLYADAYNRYLQDYSMSQDKLNSLIKLSDMDWDRYDTTRKFDFNIYQDRYDQMRNYFDALLAQDQNAFNQSEANRDQYNRDVNRAIDIWRSQVQDQQWSDEMAYQAAEDAYNSLYNQYNMGYNQYADQRDFEYQQGRDAIDDAYRQQQLALSGSRSGGGGSSSRNSNSNNNNDQTIDETIYDDLLPEPEPVPSPIPVPAQTPTIPVYTSSTGNQLWETLTEEEVADMIHNGDIVLINGRYVFTGGNYIPAPTGPTSTSKATSSTKSTNTTTSSRKPTGTTTKNRRDLER